DVATFTASTLSAGQHSIAASYSGDSSFSRSDAPPLVLVVNAPSINATLTQLAAVPVRSTYGRLVTFTALVRGIQATGDTTGSVTLSIEVKPQPPLTVRPGAGSQFVATWTSASLGVGKHAIGARYSGNAEYAASGAAPITETIDRAATTTKLVASPKHVADGQSISLTAQVSDLIGRTPGGTVTFFDGVKKLGTVALGFSASPKVHAPKATGEAFASLRVSLTPGIHSIRAVYGGSTVLASSMSTPVTER